MTSALGDHNPNTLLAFLTSGDVPGVEAELEFVTLDLHTLLFQEGEEMTHAYFPVSGMISLVTGISGTEIESGTIGAEGVLGLSLMLAGRHADTKSVVQIAGEAWRLPATAFLALMAHSPTMNHAIMRYVGARLWIAYRLGACNLKHSLGERAARWLLLVHDNVPGDRFNITHRYLAQMLGVRRAGVTVAFQSLQEKGIISSRRGSITVLDRARLENEACECDSLIRARLLPTNLP